MGLVLARVFQRVPGNFREGYFTVPELVREESTFAYLRLALLVGGNSERLRANLFPVNTAKLVSVSNPPQT